MLTNVELKELSQVSTIRGVSALLADWLVIILLFAIAIRFPYPLTYVVCSLMIGRQQLGLAIMMHDGAHKRIIRSSFWNDYVGQFLTAAPLFFSMFSYRTLHLKHHRDPLVVDDPDLSLTGGYPISKSSFIRKLLRDLLGISYFKFIRYFIYMARGQKKLKKVNSERIISQTEGGEQIVEALKGQSQISSEKMPRWMVFFSMLLMNFLIWGVLQFWGRGWLYLMWVIPMMTVLQVLLRIRGVAEHAGYQPNKDQRLNARTVLNPLQTYFFAPHQVFYHIEHHLYPSVPFYHLAQVHQLLKERNSLPESNIFYGYGPVLKQILK